MKVIGISEAKNKLSSIVIEAENGPIVLTRNGKAVAVIVAPRDDDDLEQLILSRSKKLQALLSERQKQIDVGQTKSVDEIFAHLK